MKWHTLLDSATLLCQTLPFASICWQPAHLVLNTTTSRTEHSLSVNYIQLYFIFILSQSVEIIIKCKFVSNSVSHCLEELGAGGASSDKLELCLVFRMPGSSSKNLKIIVNKIWFIFLRSTHRWLADLMRASVLSKSIETYEEGPASMNESILWRYCCSYLEQMMRKCW